MPNWSQISGMVDRLVVAALMFAVGRGWITSAEVADYAALIVAILAAIYALVVNRNTNLVKQAASVPNTTVVTSPDIAANTPKLTNVVPNNEAKVVAK